MNHPLRDPKALPSATNASSAAPDEVRCACGKLLARWLGTGLELRCTRCKAYAVIPVDRLTMSDELVLDPGCGCDGS